MGNGRAFQSSYLRKHVVGSLGVEPSWTEADGFTVRHGNRTDNLP